MYSIAPLSYTAKEIDEKLGKIVELDGTLSIDGKAADAKATGHTLHSIEVLSKSEVTCFFIFIPMLYLPVIRYFKVFL